VSDELPAYGPGAERLLRELVQRGLPAHSLPVAAALVVALDSGWRTSASTSSAATSASSSGRRRRAERLQAESKEL